VDFVALEPRGEKDDDGQQQMSEEQKRVGAEMLSLVSAWWDRVKLWQKARAATRRARWSTRGVRRTGIPTGLFASRTDGEGDDAVTTLTLPSNLSFPDALARVSLWDEEPDAAGVYIDPETLQPYGIVLYEEAVRNKRGKVTGTRQRAQVWTVEGGNLLVRVLGDRMEDTEPFTYPGVTRLPVAEMEAELLITDPVRRQQRQLNLFQSVLTRLGEVAAFPERYTINAHPFGVWLTAASTDSPVPPKVENGVTYYFHPMPRTLGASTLNEVVGFPFGGSEDGKENVTTPQVIKFDPTDPQFAVTAASYAYATILRQCHQAHVLGAENLQRSGVSIQQARADFEADVAKGKGPLESLIAATIESAIALAGSMSSEFRGFLQQYRCVVTLHVSTGPVTADERQANREDVAAGLLSPDTAMAMNGREDVADEQRKVAESVTGKLAIAKQRFETLKAAMDADVPLDFAAEQAGFTPEEAARLVQRGAAVAQ
jgi:hypothetical protein